MKLKVFRTGHLPEAVADHERPLSLEEPCSCGCDNRDGLNLGYITEIRHGEGWTLVAETVEDREILEVIYQRLTEATS